MKNCSRSEATVLFTVHSIDEWSKIGDQPPTVFTTNLVFTLNFPLFRGFAQKLLFHMLIGKPCKCFRGIVISDIPTNFLGFWQPPGNLLRH
jgi:hypothetical protein